MHILSLANHLSGLTQTFCLFFNKKNSPSTQISFPIFYPPSLLFALFYRFQTSNSSLIPSLISTQAHLNTSSFCKFTFYIYIYIHVNSNINPSIVQKRENPDD